MLSVRGMGMQLITNFMERFQLTGQREPREVTGSVNPAFDLHFHAVRGKAIAFEDRFTVARRDSAYFEHSVVFSHRAVHVNEVVAIKVVETTTDFHGPLRIGFTSYNPMSFLSCEVPLGRDLKDRAGFWLKSVQLYPIIAGTVIYFKVNQNGTVFYGVDGKCGGVFMMDVDVSDDLWMVAEAYGSVQAITLVNQSMTLTIKDDLLLNEQVPAPLSPRPGLVPPRVAPDCGRTSQAAPAPLYARRNLLIPPLTRTATLSPGKLSLMSPMTPAFVSPAPDTDFNLGLCIICMDKEKNTAFTKCGHLCMCFQCADSYKNQVKPGPTRSARPVRQKNPCPVCRQPITSLLRIYT